MEDTIDAQLTELGFSDVLRLRVSRDRSPPRALASLLDTREEPLGVRGHPEVERGEGNPAETRPAAGSESDDSDVSQGYEEELEEEQDEDEDEEEEEEDGGGTALSPSGDYRCGVCGLLLSSQFKLQDHMNLHTGARPYCCAECGKRFCQVYYYRVHLRTHARIVVDRLQCRICLKGFVSQDDLKDHLSRAHPGNEFYECDFCKRVFTRREACENHVETHMSVMDVTCNICGRKYASQKALSRHRRRACHRTFKCTDCSKTFVKKNALLKHSFSHLGLLPYTCVRCHSHFRLARLYLRHKCEPQRVHCVACLREFLCLDDFQQHKKDTGCWGSRTLRGDDVRCLECGERFDTKEELKKHAGAHQRILKCAECGKGFRSALLLMSHMGGHAGNSPCLCQCCGLGFPHQQSYGSHLKTCGQSTRFMDTPKKFKNSQDSSSDAKKDTKDSKADCTNPVNPVGLPPKARIPTSLIKDPGGPGVVTENPSTPGFGPSDGRWRLPLNEQPPLVFVPVYPTPNIYPPPAVSESLPAPAVPGDEYLKLKTLLDLDLVSRITQDRHPECEEPLDLSKKCKSSEILASHIPLRGIKCEPGKFEITN